MSTVFEQESVGGPEVTPGGGGGEGWEGGEGEGREGRGWLSVKPQGDTCINAAESGARKATKQRPKIRDLRNKNGMRTKQHLSHCSPVRHHCISPSTCLAISSRFIFYPNSFLALSQFIEILIHVTSFFPNLCNNGFLKLDGSKPVFSLRCTYQEGFSRLQRRPVKARVSNLLSKAVN